MANDRLIWSDNNGRELRLGVKGDCLIAEDPVCWKIFFWGLDGLIAPGAFRFERAVTKAMRWLRVEEKQPDYRALVERARAVIASAAAEAGR